MLAVSSPLGCGTGKDEMQNDYMNGVVEEEFCDFGGGNLLDSINFDDLFLVGINDDEDDLLPDLEMDPEILAEFSAGEKSQITTTITTTSTTSVSMEKIRSANEPGHSVDKASQMTSSDFGSDSISIQKHQQDVNPAEKRRKSSSKTSRYAPGKRKVKVDWTPELHRRFVEAVEQLGVEKAVPSRILELMGIHCLTRHNIASHLQKYRSHRKHLLAREVETANWTQKRRLYSTPIAGVKGDVNAWHAPTMCFPTMAPPVPQPFRPLHVWGHPPVNHPLMHVWPPTVVSHPPPADPSFWHSQHLRVPSSLTQGTPCFPPHLMRYPVPPVPGIPPPTMYKMEAGIGIPTAVAGQVVPQPPFDFHPSKESIDAAIGDVLLKPWLPLPLGLKPPSVDGVLVQLQHQGVPIIPPSGSDDGDSGGG